MPTLRSESDATVIYIWMTVLLLSVLPSPSLEHGGISHENDCPLSGVSRHRG